MRATFLALAAFLLAANVALAKVYSLATDTLQPANAKYHYRVSCLGTVGGRTLHVFITGLSARGNGLECTWRNPLSLPRPKPVFITSEELQWVRLGEETHYTYWEPVRLPGKKVQGLVLCSLTGPRLELFDDATRRRGVPIPLPVGPVIRTGTFSNKYNHTWYLRRPGERTMALMPGGKKFAPFLAKYLADAPALAATGRAPPATTTPTRPPLW